LTEVQAVHVRRLWWCVPACVLAVAHGCLTLWGQPAAYWSAGLPLDGNGGGFIVRSKAWDGPEKNEIALGADQLDAIRC
jgi:hypothetical protein